jgi:hypothetical protein
MNVLPPLSCSLCGSRVPGAHGIGCPTMATDTPSEPFTLLQEAGFRAIRGKHAKRTRLSPSEIRGRLDVVLFDVLSSRRELVEAEHFKRGGDDSTADYCYGEAARRLDCALEMLNYVVGLTDGAA